MRKQLSVVDLIQQHLPIKRWNHLSRLLFCDFIDQTKPIFGHNMKLSMIFTCFMSQLPNFSVWWIPRGLINTCQEWELNYQRWKKGLDMFLSSNNTRINTLTTSWVVISHSKCWTATLSIELSTGKVETNKLESLNWHFNTSKGLPYKSGYLDHLYPQTTHLCLAYSLLARSTGSQYTAPHLVQGNDANSFPLARPTLAVSQHC